MKVRAAVLALVVLAVSSLIPASTAVQSAASVQPMNWPKCCS